MKSDCHAALIADRSLWSTEPIDANKQKQPHHIDKMPIPRGGFESEVVCGREASIDGAHKTYSKKDGSHDDVESMESRCHKEGRGVDAIREGKRGFGILIGLQERKEDSKRNRAGESIDESVIVAFDEGVMRPGDSAS